MTPERWEKIEAVFQAVVDLPEADRPGFLARECGEDAEMLREVERLLDSSSTSADFIENPVWNDGSILSPSEKLKISDSFEDDAPHLTADNFVGRVLGAYRLTKEIGRGGMGAVYLAERADGEFQQRVAIKLIKRGMDSDFIIRRFRHERQILASFEHPYIARLIDGGTTSDGVPYFVMEFVEGQTFYSFCDSEKLGLRSRLEIFQKVCSAIAYAHSKKIVHRDIKPSNILIDSQSTPKLLDFGIAKILDPNLIHESLNPTASMLRLMTPDYASPEQVQGIDVTPASDIYSLGVLLYELLTGHRPYNFAGRAIHEVSYVICNSMPKLPSQILAETENLLPIYRKTDSNYLNYRQTNADELTAELQGDLDNIIMKALSKEPEGRYLSVEEFSNDISRHLAGSEIAAPKYKVSSSPSLDPILTPSVYAKSLAVLPFTFINLAPEDDTDDRFLGVGLADALITRLSKVRRFVVRPTRSISAFGEDGIDPISAGKELSVDFILIGSIKKADERLRLTAQLLNVAENAAVWATSIDEVMADVLSLEDKLAAKVVEGLLPELTSNERYDFDRRGTDDPEAFESYLRGRYYFNTFTEESFAKAFVAFHTAISIDPEYAHAYAGIADYYNWLGIMGVLPPQDCFLPAIEAARKAVDLDPQLSEAHASLGFSLHAGNYEWSRAEQHLRKAIELNPSNANAYVWYAIVMYTTGRFREGLEFARLSTDVDPLTPFNQHNVAWGLYYARRFDEAEEAYRKVVSEFPTYSFGYYGLSKVLRMKGETREAIEVNARAIDLMGHSIFSLLAEAECLAADGQRAAALEKLSDLELQSKSRYVSPYQLALGYCFLGDHEKALSLLEKARDGKEAWLNWIGVEPVLDPLRNDPRFEEILEATGYRPLFSSYSAVDMAAGRLTPRPTPEGTHDLTTLVIGDRNDTNSDGDVVRPPHRRLVYVSVAAALVTILAVGGWFLNWWPFSSIASTGPASRVQTPSIVVLPFESSDRSAAEIGVGLADALTNKLGNIKSLQVVAANTGRLMAGPGREIDIENLGISYVLRGDLETSSSIPRVKAELSNIQDGTVLFREEFVADDGNLFSLQSRLAEKVWTTLGIDPLPIERQQVERSHTEDVNAYTLYLRGRSEMANRSAENLKRAAATFSHALERDPNFALAYVGLADALALLNIYSTSAQPDAYPMAKKNVSRALEIDPNLAEAHATLGYIKFFHDRDRAGSELEFRRAIQVNPSYAPAHHWFALTLAAKGDGIDAETEIEIAKRLDPKAAVIRSAAGVVHFHLGSLTRAIAECDESIALDERSIPAYKVRRWAYTALRQAEPAADAFEREITLSGGREDEPGWKIIKIQIDGLTGDKAKLLKDLDEVAANEDIAENPFGFAYEVALAYNALDETQKALDWLQRAEASGSHSFNFLAADPRFANLAKEPRFIALKAKLN